MSNYTQYYQRIITKKNKGLKLVLGGTGLGKTSGIEEVIKSSENRGKKFIYIANRIQLLSELKEKFNENVVIHQKKDYEILNHFSNEKFETLINSNIIKNYTACLKANKFYVKKVSEIEQAFKTIKEGANNKIYKTENGRDFLNNQTHIFLSFFKKILSTAYQFSKSKIKLKDADTLNISDYGTLIDSNEIKELFPYINYTIVR